MKKVIGATVAILILTGVATVAIVSHDQAPESKTIVSCSVWADTSHPVLPANVATDQCSAPDGSIIGADGTVIIPTAK